MPAGPPSSDDRAFRWVPPARAEEILTRDRAKRFVYRIEQLATERRAHFAGERIGMTSFVEAVPTMVALEKDMEMTIDALLAGRVKDRERGETEIPFVVVVEGVLERLRRARVIEEARRASRAPASWAQERLLALLADAVRRLNAFVEVYDAKRFLSVPASTDVEHVLALVENDVAVAHPSAAGFTPTASAGTKIPLLDRRVPPILTSADGLEDLLRAARAEMHDAKPPWHATRASPSEPLVLSIGAALDDRSAGGLRGPEVGSPESLLGPSPEAARTDRAAAVLKFAHGVSVARTSDAEGLTVGVHLSIADGGAAAIAKRLAPSGEAVALSPDADAAMRTYMLAAAKEPDALAPSRLVAVMGVMRAVDKALDRALRPLLDGSAAAVVARAVPRESSRKAPVHREVLATLSAAIPGFPSHRASEVLDAAADGKSEAAATRPPDAAVLLAVLTRRWATGKPFGDAVIGVGVWADDEAMQCVRDVVRLAEIRTALDRGRDPGPQWAAQFEGAAFGLLARLARLSART